MHKINLQRRGLNLGEIDTSLENPKNTKANNQETWAKGYPILLQGFGTSLIAEHSNNMGQTKQLYRDVLNDHDCSNIVDLEPYRSRLRKNFEVLGSSFSEGNQQEIETLFFDATDKGKLVAEDLWIKISWLSFIENDASMRFRFSFGVDFEEDVAADHIRQHHASELTNAIFPESVIISENDALADRLCEILDFESFHFVERIIYFNAPNGGAYFHHDRERGHAGVVYAQLSGSTYWLALPKQSLVDEINGFINESKKHSRWPSSITGAMQKELIALNGKPNTIAIQLDTFANSTLLHLINETEAFVQRLIEQGHGQLIKAGDFLLLPQGCENLCCWHSVFNVGEEAGEALSFAIRGA